MKKNNYMMFASAFVLALLASCASTPDGLVETPEQKKAIIFYQQGTQELIDKNYTNALNYLLKARDLNPNDSEIRNNLGMAYYLKNQIDKAKTEFQKALSLNPKNSDARNNYASVLFQQKKYKDALEEYTKVSEDLTYTKMFRVFYNLALIYKYEGKDELSFDYLTKSITENPDYCPAHFEIGNYYTQKYQFKDALNAYQEATKGACVKEPASHFEIAMTLTRLNRVGEAQLKLKEVQEKFPKTRYAILAKEELGRIQEDQQISQKITPKEKSTEEINNAESNRFETPKF